MTEAAHSFVLIGVDKSVINQLQEVLSQIEAPRFRLVTVRDVSEAQQYLSEDLIAAVVLSLDQDIENETDIPSFVQTQASHIPVIALVENEEDPLIHQAFRWGIQDYLIRDAIGIGSPSTVQIIRNALDRHRIQQKLRYSIAQAEASTARLLTIINKNADGIIVVDREGHVQFVNPAAETLLGRSAERLLGQAFGFPIIDGNRTELDILRNDGEIFVAEMRVVETHWENDLAYVVSLRDITERKRNQEALRDAEAFSRAILNSLTTHIAVVDEHGTIVAVNEAWLIFTAESGDTLQEHTGVGANYFEALRNASKESMGQAPEALQGIHTVLNGEQPSFELEYAHRSPLGDHWFLMRVVPLQSDRQPGLVIAHSDITDQKRAAKARAEAEALRERMLEQEREMKSFEHFSALPATEATVRPAGLGSLRERDPDAFNAAVDNYTAMLEKALKLRAYKIEGSLEPEIEHLARMMGQVQSSPRDVVELHLTAIRKQSATATPQKLQVYMEEGRVLVLELMGNLTSFYRSYVLSAQGLVNRGPAESRNQSRR